ncbi:MAG: ABC transporter permease [Clostridia bacterium]|nr:ABC transporter permease [Clostridia bacterium]
MNFEKSSFGGRLGRMLNVDFRRMFRSPLFWIMMGICFVAPVLILVMTTMMDGSVSVDPQTGVETVMEAFDNVWQAVESVSGSGMAMNMMAMCNINLLFFAAAVLVSLFVSEDFKSGYAKNLFTVRPKKADYVISKLLVGWISGALMLLAYFVGAMFGGVLSGLSFDAGVTMGEIVMCLVSKMLLMGVFVAIDTLASVIGKQKTWMSMVGSLAVGMLLFMMIPSVTPLDSTPMNAVLCLVAGIAAGGGLGAVSCAVLKKTSVV